MYTELRGASKKELEHRSKDTERVYRVAYTRTYTYDGTQKYTEKRRRTRINQNKRLRFYESVSK